MTTSRNVALAVYLIMMNSSSFAETGVADQVMASRVTTPVIVGHRGASHDAPENTLAAFRLAFEQNADGIEGDFYLTADDKIICHHDKDAKRTGGKKLVIEKTDFADLRRLDVGAWKQTQYAGERMPTLREVIATIPMGKLFVVELKSGPAIVPVLKAELDAIDRDDINYLIISFDQQVIADCKRLLPGFRAHWLTSFKQKTPFSAFKPSAADVVQTVRACSADGVGMNGNAEVVDQTFIEQLKQGGVQEYHFWTIDSADRARQLREWGAYGITTNRPDFIRESLSN